MNVPKLGRRGFLQVLGATVGAAALATKASAYDLASLYKDPFLTIPAWTSIPSLKRYPSSGTFDLHDMAYVGGPIGLNPAGDFSRGVVTFYWTIDAAGEHVCGVQGMHLTSSIPSLAELRLPNRGPYLFVTYQPYAGPNPLAASLFGTNVGGKQPLLCGDTILIDEQEKTLAAATLNTAVPPAIVPMLLPIYPCDYFAGEVRVYFAAPTGVKATLQGADLTDQFWILEEFGPGRFTTIVPLGTWGIVINNPTLSPITYTLSVTPLIT